MIPTAKPIKLAFQFGNLVLNIYHRASHSKFGRRSHWLRGIEPKKSPAKKILAGLVREGSGDLLGAAPVVPGRPFTFDPGAAHDSPAYAAPWIISCACCVRGYDAARRVAAEVYPKISNPREIEPATIIETVSA